MIPRRAYLIALLLLLVLAAGTRALEPDRIHLRSAVIPVSELPAPDPATIFERGEAGRAELLILHFGLRPGAAERRAILDAGAEILGYLPVNAYLMRAAAVAAARLAELPGVDALVAYRPEWKLSPDLGRASLPDGRLRLTLSFAPGASPEALAAAVRAQGAELTGASASPQRPRLWLLAEPALLDGLSRLPELLWISETLSITPRNDNIKWICQSAVTDQTPIWDRGLHGEGQIIGHIDSDLDWANCWFEDPEGDPVGPDHRKLVFCGDYPGSGGTHGTHTAGTLAADRVPITGDPALRGLAYEARLAHSNYVNEWGYDLYADLVLHSGNGARVHSNSWGNDWTTLYTEWCYDIDLFSWEYEDEMVVFASTNLQELKTPENAKNVLAVGSSQSGENFNLKWGGGAGPTADGRRKPEIFAPGLSIYSSRAWQYCLDMSRSGTSMACPAVTAGAALVRQYFLEGFYPTGVPLSRDALTPSGALLRAVLLNSTAIMHDPLFPGYPNDDTGWGRLLLDEALFFSGETRRLWIQDLRHAQGIESGQSHVYDFEIFNLNEALEITLVFTDYPGEVEAAEPVVNDLDLVLLGPTGEYLGNVFDTVAGESVTGGERDSLNMVERVVINVPAEGPWQIQVHAPSVPMGPQGYALALSAGLVATPVLLEFFDVRGETGAVSVSWALAAASDPADFCLEAGRAGEGRDLLFTEPGPGRFEARDEDPSLLAGGRFTYSLYSRDGEREWQLLRSEAIELEGSLAAARLLGVHPNPFNPRTTIAFALPSRQHVRLRIHDLAGRSVATLADGSFAAGTNRVTWLGLDDEGRPASSGVYFARLEAPGVSQSRKLVLLR